MGLEMLTQLQVIGVVGVIFATLLYWRAPLWVLSIAVAGISFVCGVSGQGIYIVLGVLLAINVPFLQRLLTYPVFFVLKTFHLLPTISKTEREAIEAGSVWVDAELFSGKPDFGRLMRQEYPLLSLDEQAFLNGPVNDVCQKVHDWEVYQNRGFSDEIWEALKTGGFFGLIIPKEYGGLGFSPLANSSIVAKLSTRSTPLGITVMVPNSLGPAELLVHYGTQAQKEHYLPRLASGEDIPCFALTEPNAGSDAGAMQSSGTVFKDNDGALKMRLTWNKRYITLAAKATLLGLAFKLSDPDNLLGQGTDLGITCALIPVDTAGVVVGNRHDALGVPFYNCPTLGTDVVLPVSAIIGEESGAGNGWKMLMECLSAGRGISLPATSTGGAKFVTRVVGAYSMIRKQFGLEIGKFEGIHEPMARIAGYSYMMEAGRRYMCGGLAEGEKPAVLSAIMKYHFTELFREVINDGMDVCGGAGISLGPRNLLGHAYMAVPIGITVEGANILTRSLMIFGQGAIRCHPYVLTEIHAIEDNDSAAFSKAFVGHKLHVISNAVRMLWLTLTRGLLVFPHRIGATSRYYQKLTWASATFAFVADVALITFGGGLKIKERLTSRFGDVLSWMYFASTVLRRYEAEGCLKEDLPFVHWCMQTSFAKMQQAFSEVFANMGPLFVLARVMAWLCPIGSLPSDKVSAQMVQCIQKPGEQRDRMTDGLYVSEDKEDPLGRLEHAFTVIYGCQDLYKRLKRAVHTKVLVKQPIRDLIDNAVEKNVISKEEAQRLIEAENCRDDAVLVDEFTPDEYLAGR